MAMQIFIIIVAILLGTYKGWDILAPVAEKNLLRLRRLPQPSPLWQVFSKSTWIVIAIMMGIGLLLRAAPMPHGMRATVLLAVGLGMLYGAANYLRRWHLVRGADKHAPTPSHQAA